MRLTATTTVSHTEATAAETQRVGKYQHTFFWLPKKSRRLRDGCAMRATIKRWVEGGGDFIGLPQGTDASHTQFVLRRHRELLYKRTIAIAPRAHYNIKSVYNIRSEARASPNNRDTSFS